MNQKLRIILTALAATLPVPLAVRYAPRDPANHLKFIIPYFLATLLAVSALGISFKYLKKQQNNKVEYFFLGIASVCIVVTAYIGAVKLNHLMNPQLQ